MSDEIDLLKLASAAHHAEAVEMNATLKAQTDEDLAGLLLRATDIRLGLEKDGKINLLRPSRVLHSDPMWCAKVAQLVAEYESEKDFTRANGLVVWLLTVRAASDDGLRELGQSMWQELSRAFPALAEVERHPEASEWTTTCARAAQSVPKGMTSVN